MNVHRVTSGYAVVEIFANGWKCSFNIGAKYLRVQPYVLSAPSFEWSDASAELIAEIMYLTSKLKRFDIDKKYTTWRDLIS